MTRKIICGDALATLELNFSDLYTPNFPTFQQDLFRRFHFTSHLILLDGRFFFEV
jgi:hypothetical protein